ncbi:hypothetical protein [Spiroplasma endosymbiont of Dasysyrphus albostriatus]|uniref:hypothetical protein n=1 Tax=Spiroplasma endosymbiont of Dasysyrphus albostriatus TaxID=3066299 RepID=UPI0030CC9A24
MINKLWTGVSLENYNNWYPLTGKITETPQQYIKTWPNVNDWFTTFAIRAQNDINAYLDFILSKFPFDSFKDELIKETLRDMVYVMVEHWVFNRTPIEFNVDATIQFNNGTQFSANSTPTINVWDLAPSRMKIWARLTELKQIFSSYNDDEIDVEKIDLKAFYTRNQIDKLIKEQKEFTLSKQMKLYDDLVDDNENEIYRGPVTKFINKGYVATDYDKESETMILDWPDEIGTLPPEALQNNPQIGDYTHAPTCDFSAKQQKRITTNENEITKLNTELIKANENINDVKNNWFNIETSPLWKKVENNNIETFKWYFIKISYQYSTENDFMKFYKVIKIYLNNVFNEFELLNVDSMTYKEQISNKNILNIGTIYYDNRNKKFSGGGNSYPERGKINLIGDIKEIYQYQGIDTPTEFIAEESTERDYYTKIETNNLLDKKQNKLIAGENIKIDEKTNTISATGGKADLSDYYKKEEVDKKIEDTKSQFPIAFQINAVSKEIPNLETTNKTVAGAINQNKNNIDKKQDKENWVVIGKKVDNRTWDNFNIDLNKTYRVFITWHRNAPEQNGYPLMLLFKSAKAVGTGTWTLLIGKIDNKDASLILKADYTKSTNKWSLFIKCEIDGGAIFSFEELKENTYQITSNTLNITSPSVINIDKPIKINSKSLETNEIEENNWDIRLLARLIY